MDEDIDEDMQFIWDDGDGGNVEHIGEHEVTPQEAEEVVRNRLNDVGVSHSTGMPVTFGYTTTGRFLIVVWEEQMDDPRTVYVVTAYDVPEP